MLIMYLSERRIKMEENSKDLEIEIISEGIGEDEMEGYWWRCCWGPFTPIR